MREALKELLEQYRENELVIAIVAAAFGALLTKLIPFLWGLLGKLLSGLRKVIGGKSRYRDFEKDYLDWVVTDLRELKLTGIVSHDSAKKPQLEQVFVSLQVGRQRERTPTAEAVRTAVEDILEAYGGFPTWHELARALYQKLGTPDPVQMYEIELFLLDQLESPEQRKRLKRKGWLARLRFLIMSYFYLIRLLSRRHYRHIFSGREPTALEPLEEKLGAWARAHGMFLQASEGTRLKRTLHEHQRLAILGVPGAGKTTLLQHIGLCYAQERAGDPGLCRRGILKEELGTRRWRLPIFVPLRSIAGALVKATTNGRPPSIIDVLPQILPPDLQREYGDVISGYFVHQLSKDNCILLLDGLDEVPTDAEFRAVVRAIESLVLAYKRNRFVVTSRIAGWRSGIAADFEIFYVNDLTDEQVNTFIDSWYSAVERNAVVGRLEDESTAERKAREREATRKADELKQALHENLGIRRLATNPMLLSIIALVHRSLATLPKERSKLYAKCSEVLLEQWDISRGIRVDDTNLKLEQKEAIMQRLGLAFHTGEIGEGGSGREASRAEVEKIIAGVLPGLGPSADRAPYLLQRLIERSGIITERRRDILSFAHLTFQEYFTAQYLAIGDSIEYRDYLLNPKRLLSDWWHEVILLYAGLLPDSGEFLRLIHKPSADDLCQQRLRPAALCWGESVAVKSDKVRQLIAVELLRVRTRGEVTSVKQTVSPEVVEYLIRWAKGQEWYTHAALANAKAACDNAQEGVIHQKLLEALEDQQSAVRSSAIEALSSLPTYAISKELINRTITLLADKDPDVRHNAAKALGVIGKIHPSKEKVLGLAAALRDPQSSVRMTAMMALEALGDEVWTYAPAILADLDSVLSDKSIEVRFAAAKAFPVFASQATAEQIDAFIKILAADQWWWMLEAEVGNFLEQTAPDSVVSKVVGLLESSESSDKLVGTQALAYLNAEAASRYKAIDKLVALLGGESSSVRALAIAVLGNLAEKALFAEIHAKIVRLLDDQKRDVRIDAIRTIERLGEVAVTDSVLEKLLDALNAKESNVRSAAASALIVSDTSTVQERVVKALMVLARDDHSPDVRATALQKLGVSGVSTLTDEVVDTVILSLDDRNESVRSAAAGALRQLGARAARESAVNKLLKALEAKPLVPLLIQKILVRRRPEQDFYGRIIDPRYVAYGIHIEPEFYLSFLAGQKQLTFAWENRAENWRSFLDASLAQRRLFYLFQSGDVSWEFSGQYEIPIRAIAPRRVMRSDLRTSAISALGVLGVTVETERVFNILCRLAKPDNVRSVKDLAVVVTALVSLAFLGSRTASEQVFNELIESDYGALRGPYGDLSDYVPEPGIWLAKELEIEPITFAGLLEAVGRELPTDFVLTKLKTAFMNSQAQKQVVILEALTALSGKVMSDAIRICLIAALQSEIRDTRVAVINIAKELVQQGTMTKEVVTAIEETLKDDKSVIRERAWEVVEKSYKLLGIWK